MVRKKKCPNCNSSRITYNENEEMNCKRCGYVHSDLKKSQLIDFQSAEQLE